MNLAPLPRAVLHGLASGAAVPGAVVAARAGMAAAAVAGQVDALRAAGLPIAAIEGDYQLAWPLQLLDAAAIEALLPAGVHGALEVHWQLDSTSSELGRRRAGLPDLAVVLAEGQQAGRGRRGRAWLSPPGLNVYLSCLKRFARGLPALSGLSLAVGVAVADALEELGVAGVGLKWPNDVLVAGGKLAGILVELHGAGDGACAAIVGVGVNVRLTAAMRAQIGQPVADLAELCGGTPPDRNVVAAALVAHLRDALRRFDAGGFGGVVGAYARRDLLRGCDLRLCGPDGAFTGIGAGVDARGALLVQTDAGVVRVDSADVTVRIQ